MGLESASFISDLVVTNPPGTDLRSQGDDHIRLIKTVLKATFPGANKAFIFNGASGKTANFTITAAEANTTFYVSTASGPVLATLPALAAGDAGWECSFIKITTDVNPMYVKPPAGTIQSGAHTVDYCRRCIPGTKFSAMWNGSNWFCERVVQAPVGAIVDFDGTSVPVGFELPNGQTLAGTLGSVYPEYYAAKGSLVTRDLTGYVTAMKEAVATRLTAAVSGIDGATLGSVGGGQSQAIAQTNLPNVTLTTTIAAGQGSHTHTQSGGDAIRAGGNSLDAGPFPAPAANAATPPTIAAATLPAMTGTTPLGGSGTAFSIAQPTIVLNKLLVVE